MCDRAQVYVAHQQLFAVAARQSQDQANAQAANKSLEAAQALSEQRVAALEQEHAQQLQAVSCQLLAAEEASTAQRAKHEAEIESQQVRPRFILS